MQHRPPRVVVFDLDDTLYLERDFAMSGFKAVGDWFQRETGIGGLQSICTRLFEQGNRKTIFDDALRELALEQPSALVSRLIEVYRHHVPEITLADDARRYLEQHVGHISLGLITDGLAVTQWAKIRSLNIAHFFDCIVCTGDWGHEFSKPHPRSYEFMEKQFLTLGHEMVYIADNPAKDFVTPKARGWRTVQLVRAGRIHTMPAVDQDHAPDQRIDTLDGFEPFARTAAESH